MIPVIRIEGNIGVGKTSLLKHLEDDEPPVHVICEPVEGWTCHLRGLYASANPRAWSLPMQTLAMCTRSESLVAALEIAANGSDRRPVVVERSAVSAGIFARATLSGDDMGAYDVLVQRYEEAMADAFEVNGAGDAATVYLRAEPQTCFERVQKRARRSEDQVTMEYLERVHDEHERLVAGGATLIVNAGDKSSVQVAQEVKTFLSQKFVDHQ